ncbi:MAG: tRNA (adenosine(37)-N6)-threonylcarbamoyltransferase complex dimerization subunit type 1 TsaB [Chitinivibrionia bacterium]|nr:tRNA (adenosine(37)-N6)-threonylcarbamoyltransferase complex dimerization subunit type 1 TsaB [Chitinivibrionia bacterium]
MITLGIDTSMSVVSFAVARDGCTLARFNEDVGKNLADKISNIIKELLISANVESSEIERCGIVVGPGSFTGLRVGIAFAKGLFAGADTKIASISSLECIARSSGETGNICVFSDARQGEVFFAKFRNDGEFVRLSDDERILREEALSRREVGDKTIELSDELSLSQTCGETAANIALSCQNLTTIDEVFPNYMQVSYAERCKK